ncbi:hypothetical protein NDU88_005871 [Pleurodeles waltl]|uniref:Uncharacterized protein n=1 Tax=Pleurodeles waltl TaxID=8319 RepID=A0AAV7X0T1_PLEWA|nr:hypothetical protein NDU88_005871 [Pleurodeles waltl]
MVSKRRPSGPDSRPDRKDPKSRLPQTRNRHPQQATTVGPKARKPHLTDNPNRHYPALDIGRDKRRTHKGRGKSVPPAEKNKRQQREQDPGQQTPKLKTRKKALNLRGKPCERAVQLQRRNQIGDQHTPRPGATPSQELRDQTRKPTTPGNEVGRD